MRLFFLGLLTTLLVVVALEFIGQGFTAIAAPARIQSNVPGRYLIVAGRVPQYESDAKDAPQVFKLDTATGRTWIYCPLEIGAGANAHASPHRWLEFGDFVPKPVLAQPVP